LQHLKNPKQLPDCQGTSMNPPSLPLFENLKLKD
jgi:hypothetical protein